MLLSPSGYHRKIRNPPPPTRNSRHFTITGLDVSGIPGRDYKVVRRVMSNIVATSGFINLTSIEKRIASRWFVLPAHFRIQVHTIEEQITNGRVFHRRSIRARTTRLQQSKMEIWNRLTHDQLQEIIGDVHADNIESQYIDFGVEGTIKGDYEGVFDFVVGTSGTQYENRGLVNYPYTPSGMANMRELSDRIIDILDNGNYDDI